MKFLTFLMIISFSVAYGQKNRTQNVVLISIDGYRWQEIFQGADSAILSSEKYCKQNPASLLHKYWAPSEPERRQKLMPFFWSKIATEGQLYGNRKLDNRVNVRNRYRFSYPGRSESLCGYYDPGINSNAYPNNPNENVLEFLNIQKGYEGKVATFASWDAVSRIVNRDRNKMFVNIPGERVNGLELSEAQILSNELQQYLPMQFGGGSRFDVHTYAIAKSYIFANHPKVIHIDFGDPDNFGHAGQYDSYLDAGHYLDAMIGSLWASMQEDDFYSGNTTFLVYPDHGRGANKNWMRHGFFAPRSDETWLAVLGPDTPGNGEMNEKQQIFQDQFAQTAAQLLGFNFTANHPVAEPVPMVSRNTISLKVEH